MISVNNTKANYSFTAAFVGDIMLARGVDQALGSAGFQDLSLGLSCLLEGADISSANLESPIAYRSQCFGGFKASPQSAKALECFDVLNLANNHIFDCGDDGVLETIDFLNNLDIQHVGVGLSKTEAFSPRIIKKKGRKVGFIGCCCKTLLQRQFESTISIATLQDPHLEETLRSIRPHVDILCLHIHAGNEYVPYPPPSLRRKTQDLLQFADIVVTHHPHVLGGYEVRQDGRLAWYSLWDFVFDSTLECRRQSGVLFVHYDNRKNEIQQFTLLPTLINNRGIPQLAEPKAAEKIHDNYRDISRCMNTSSYDKIYNCYYIKALLRFQIHRLFNLFRKQGLFSTCGFALSRIKYVPHYLKSIIRGHHR